MLLLASQNTSKRCQRCQPISSLDVFSAMSTCLSGSCIKFNVAPFWTSSGISCLKCQVHNTITKVAQDLLDVSYVPIFHELSLQLFDISYLVVCSLRYSSGILSKQMFNLLHQLRWLELCSSYLNHQFPAQLSSVSRRSPEHCRLVSVVTARCTKDHVGITILILPITRMR